MGTKLEHPLEETAFIEERKIIPENDAFMHFLMRNESLRSLELKLNESEKITQGFLKSALEILIQSNMDLEHKLSIALLKLEYLHKSADTVLNKVDLTQRCVAELFEVKFSNGKEK